MRACPFLCLLISLPLFAGEVFTDPKSGITLLHAEIDLPAQGDWLLSDASLQSDQLGYGYIEAPEAHYEQAFGERTRALQERRLLMERRRLLSHTRYQFRYEPEQAMEISPQDTSDLDLSPRTRQAFDEGIIALLPDVPLNIEKDTPPQPLLIELKPQINDGKHFIFYNNWKRGREVIDPEKLAAWGLNITLPPSSEGSETVRYRFNARLLNPQTKAVTVTLFNTLLGEEKTVTIPVQGKTDDRSHFAEWAEYRAYAWWAEESRLASMWDARVKDLYGVENFEPADLFPGDNRNRTPSVMGVLGGDAAIRETLQMQNLRVVDTTEKEGEIFYIPIEKVKGVTVKAHDYAALLKDKPGSTLPLANLCPPDRLFAWFPKPEGILQLLDGSGNVLGRFSGSRSKLILDHQILEKHLAKLGLNEQQLRLILQSGFVGETAVILPDLFLSEGTDVTTLTRINNLAALQPLLKGMGIHDSAEIQSLPTLNEGNAFLLIQEDLLIFSTQASELELIQQILQGNGNSLGRSAEFRYMLTQCAPTDETAAYVYLSDPFIRRLTGPALKIAQMRRLQAKARLEQFSAGDLLYRMDHRTAAPDLQTLVEQAYLPPSADIGNLQWKNSVATDPIWGSANHLPTLTGNLPEKVTHQEKKAYDNYRERYERFWRQFFDPIAVRVDLKPEQEVETTLFILPLINSSIYDNIRTFFRNQEGSAPLQRPVIDPAPIAMMSLNLSEELWIDFLEGVSDVVEDQLGMNLPIWEQLGPGLHVGLADSNSVITFGSGELMHLFGASTNMRGNEMLFLPLFGSLLTRPVVVAMDLQDPEAARRALRSLVTGTLMDDEGWLGLNVNLVKITGEDKWLLRIALEDMLFFTLSMEIQDRYLVFSNLPLNYHPTVTGSEALNFRDASVLLQPDAIQETGPGFEASALDQARKQALAGLGVLNLYYMAGFDSLEDAMATSQRLFGYVPVHPSPGEFIWTERGPESTVFGSITDTQQPPLDQVDTTGLFPQTEKVEVSMQLENEGLRTRVLWKGKQK
ncbi:hypothetical protein P0Y35_18630 [Kiritimatiellaeota bacterium B1221]|nr:hypothetical protein [Kiritimatiellaeota bacterium B1221]